MISIGLLLLIFSIFATLVLFIPNLSHIIYDSFRYKNTRRRIGFYLLNAAKAIDIMCNTLYSPMLNAWFIKHNGYHFGKDGETVSSALGKNQVFKTLTYTGQGLAGILDLLDKDHCWKSIDNKDITGLYNKPEKVKTRIILISFLILISALFSSYKLFKFIF